MMDECVHIQDIMVEALYDELEAPDRDRFRMHLQECTACAAHYRELQTTLTIMDRREYPELTTSYWKRYREKLERRLPPEGVPAGSLADLWENIRTKVRWESQWAYRIAAGLALVIIGIIIGRVYLSPPVPTVTETTSGSVPVQNAAVVQQTRQFLERSKLVLMGLVNMDLDQEAEFMEDFSVQRDVSQSLVQEAGSLKKKLATPQQQRLRELVSELEMILRQIANLDKRYDMDEIQIIRLGVKRKFLLFKINVEEMNAAPPDSTTQQEQSKKLVL